MHEVMIDILRRIDTMPDISANTMRILYMVSGPEYDINDIVKLVSMDITLTAECLKVVNSAAYGLAHPINSIDKAVTYLGSNELVSIIIKHGFRSYFSQPLKGYNGEIDLWAHSLRVAIASAMIVRNVALDDVEENEAYVAGLLHDIGKVITAEFLAGNPQYLVGLLAHGEDFDFAGFEREVLNIDHAEAGYMLAHNWCLPRSIQGTILYHHQPGEADADSQSISAVVHLADLLAIISQYDIPVEAVSYRKDPFVDAMIRFNKPRVIQIIDDINAEYQKTSTQILDSANGDSLPDSNAV